MNCAERREWWGEQHQDDNGGGNCSSAAGRMEGVLPCKRPGLWGAAQERQEEKGQRKGSPSMQQSMTDRPYSSCCSWPSLHTWPKDVQLGCLSSVSMFVSFWGVFPWTLYCTQLLAAEESRNTSDVGYNYRQALRSLTLCLQCQCLYLTWTSRIQL